MVRFQRNLQKSFLYVRTQKRKIRESNGSVKEGPGYKESYNEGSSIFELVSSTICILDVTQPSLIIDLCSK